MPRFSGSWLNHTYMQVQLASLDRRRAGTSSVRPSSVCPAVAPCPAPLAPHSHKGGADGTSDQAALVHICWLCVCQICKSWIGTTSVFAQITHRLIKFLNGQMINRMKMRKTLTQSYEAKNVHFEELLKFIPEFCCSKLQEKYN